MIITLTASFIAELNSRYSFRGYTQVLDEKHFYASTILVNSTPFVVCIPLHSYCRANYISITLPNSGPHWKKHGLEYGKMLLLKPTDLTDHASISGIDSSVWNDILLKDAIITSAVKSYVIEILNSKAKLKKGLYLSSSEKNNLYYSTLNCFETYLTELSAYNVASLDFKFVSCSSIEDLINAVNSSITS